MGLSLGSLPGGTTESVANTLSFLDGIDGTAFAEALLTPKPTVRNGVMLYHEGEWYLSMEGTYKQVHALPRERWRH